MRELSRKQVIAAGMDEIDRHGPDGVSMRGLAKRLGVTPMALYNHVSSKQDLFQAAAASVLDEARFDAGAVHWRTQVEQCFTELRRLCRLHEGLAALLQWPGVAPASVFAPMEVSIRALRNAGLNDLDAVRTYFTLVTFTIGQAAYEMRGPAANLEPAENIRSKRLKGRGYETVESLTLPATWDFDGAFDFGLGLILDGVEKAVSKEG